MKKRILSTLLALCMVLALLPSEMARADIKYINSRTDLEAWINGDITYGPIRGDTFAWELQGAQTPPILEIPAERPLTVEGNWEIPSDVTIINRGMAQLRAASSITVNGTWRNVRNGIRSDGQSNLVVNGTFIADGSLAELCNTTVSSGAAISVINGLMDNIMTKIPAMVATEVISVVMLCPRLCPSVSTSLVIRDRISPTVLDSK